ncbi:unnamed protein product [Nippostrongylus brasiliensis]|uniref:Leucine-rich repeat-containing protein let-4 n=1 Tax=Nippostrongylus brasiliensis TaxID=27835 RepID=A0A0N4Y2V9_NIPBR|nr:unnamed protein product [Nippostrongylus brasiliensis]
MNPKHQLVVFLGILCFMPSGHSCPQSVLALCRCIDLHNGVQLDCSNSDGTQVVQVLRDNQALLGLVQELTMHNSSLQRLPSKFLNGLYIKRLDLSYNEIVKIDDTAFSGMSPVVQELILSHNNLTKIPSAAISSLGTLLRLDLSNNSIADISQKDTFPSLPKLYDINLGSNNICAMHSATFENVKNSIQVINLGHNCLRAVPSSSIRGLKQLQALHVQKNNISALEALNFLNLPVLNLLNLAGNKIAEINRQAFLNVPQLKYLYLTNNQIAQLIPHQFASFDQIEMIDLTGNMITEIPSRCMAQLPQLRQLFLGGNRIRTIGKEAFANSSIVILSLINNELEEVGEFMLDGMANLQSVVLKGNKIRNVDTNAFYNAPSLVMIDLSENQIMDLSPSTFLAQLNLQMIDLRNNNITRTPYAALNHRIGAVFLQENPLVCTEKIHMLQDGQGVFISNSEDKICGGRSTTTTITTTRLNSTPVPIRRLSPKRPTMQNVMPSGAFSQAGLIEDEQETLEKGKPLNIHSIVEEKQKPSYFPKQIVRSRGMHSIHTSSTELPENDVENFTIGIEDTTEETVPVKTHNNGGETSMKTTDKQSQPSSRLNHVDNPDAILPLPIPFLKEPQPSRENTVETQTKASSGRSSSPTFIIVLCMTVVAVVMITVLIGLCIMRHRHIARFTSASRAAHTSAYVSAQAAQMNAIYGTMEHNRS